MRATRPQSQPDKALALLRRSGLTRLSEFRRAGITAATISRLEAAGEITRLARGLYQLADADVDANHTLAEASKLVPKGVICLTSALAYHGLTDQIPARVWLAIGSKDWRPRLTYPPMRFAHYSPEQLKTGVERHRIDGVSVPIFSVAKTVADLFRHRAGMYSTLAGFVEAGESLEQTLAREVREEVAIEVTNIRYFGSQPWPFPHSLMVGFTADYAGGEIQVDGEEIVDARWFSRDDLPNLPPNPSIARKLIDAWLHEPTEPAARG